MLKNNAICYLALDMILSEYPIADLDFIPNHNKATKRSTIQSFYIRLNSKGKALRIIFANEDYKASIAFYGDIFGDGENQIFVKEDIEDVATIQKFIMISKSEFDII